MPSLLRSLAYTVATTFITVGATSLSDVCTTTYAKAALPANAYPGTTIDSSSLTAEAYYNASFTDETMFPDATFDVCNVTFAYSHDGRDDRVLVTYWLPSPDKFQNRFLATGGGGLAINSGNTSVAGGIPHGAAGGLTDGGFGGFDNQVDAVFLLANNTINWEATYMFGYQVCINTAILSDSDLEEPLLTSQAIHEMTVIGKAFTTNFFKANSTKLYTYCTLHRREPNDIS